MYPESGMPKTKNKVPKEKPYDHTDLQRALEAVREGSTVSQASRMSRVPRTTINNKLSGRYPEDCSHGRPSILSCEVESELLEWALGCADRWHPISKEQILDSVKILCETLKLPNSFTGGRPGYTWYKNFLTRHPELSERTPQNFSVPRASVTSSDLKEWFQSVEESLRKNNLMDVPPQRIFNTDESAFFLTPEDGRVLARRGSRVVPYGKNSKPKECLTVLVTVSASGQLAPPMAVHKLDKITREIATHNAKGWGMGMSPKSGWMDGPLFFDYVVNVFFPWLKEQGTVFPVILYLDGHASHVTLPLSKFCNENGIVLILLFPNSTHLLQPLDTAFFSPLKKSYTKEVKRWRMNNTSGGRFKPMHVPKVLSAALNHMDLQKIAANGFRGCGIVPFNPSVVDKMDLLNPGQLALKDESDQSHLQKEKDTLNTCATSRPAAHYKYALEVLEEDISDATLQQYKECRDQGIWNGSFESEDLFHFWCRTKEKYEVLETSNELLTCEFEDTSMEHIRLQQEKLPSSSGYVTLSDHNFLDSDIIFEDTVLNESISFHGESLIIEPITNENPIVSPDDINSCCNNQDIEHDENKSPLSHKFLELSTSETEQLPILQVLKERVFWPGELPKARQKVNVKGNDEKRIYVVTSDEVIAEKQAKEDEHKQKKVIQEAKKNERQQKKQLKEEEDIRKKQAKEDEQEQKKAIQDAKKLGRQRKKQLKEEEDVRKKQAKLEKQLKKETTLKNIQKKIK
ncbi:hypothetical protein DMENIID0001_057610 [Sergentomyia squamirostris]